MGRVCVVNVAELLDRTSGARLEGETVRQRVLGLLEQCDTVTVDVAGFVAGPGFVDQCFGLLMLDLGPEVFGRRVRAVNLDAGGADVLLKHVLARRARQFRRGRAGPAAR